MATVIEFRSIVSRDGSHAGGDGAGAEIIIFPGVRIERWQEPAKPARRTRPRVKRDRLEIPD